MIKVEDKIKNLLTFLLNLVTNKFTGSIEVHFNEGNVAKIWKHEVIK